MKKIVTAILCVGIIGAIASRLTNEDVFERLKAVSTKLTEEGGESMVWLKINLQLPQEYSSYYGQENMEAASTGIIISHDGTFVTAFSNPAGGQATINIKSIHVEIEGEKYEARELVRDKEYSLLFARIKPEELEKISEGIKPLDYKNHGTIDAGEVALGLTRGAEDLGNPVTTSLLWVNGKVTRPIDAYIVYYNFNALVPVFNSNGQITGLITTYSFPDEQKRYTLLVPMETLSGLFDRAVELELTEEEEVQPEEGEAEEKENNEDEEDEN